MLNVKFFLLSLNLLICGISFQAYAEFIVKQEDIFDLKPVCGTTESSNKEKLRARISGTIAKLYIDEGMFVKKGDIVAIIIDPKNESAIEAIDASIESAIEETHRAKNDFERAKKLQSQNVLSDSELDKAKSTLKVLEKKCDELLANKEAKLKNIEEGQVIAGVSGKVLSVPLTSGSVVMQGDVIAEITDDDFIIRLEIPESYDSLIKIDAIINLEDGKTGVIKKIYPQIKSGKITVDIKCSGIENNYIGKVLNAYIKTKSYKGYLVPKEYLIKKHGMHYVKIKNIGEVSVQVGRNIDHKIEILSGVKDKDILEDCNLNNGDSL